MKFTFMEIWMKEIGIFKNYQYLIVIDKHGFSKINQFKCYQELLINLKMPNQQFTLIIIRSINI